MASVYATALKAALTTLSPLVMTMSGNHRDPTASSPARTEKLDLRLTPTAKRLLQDAAAASGRTVSEFVLESALARAEATLPDRRRFGLDAEAWGAFLAALDAPPQTPPRLARLLDQPSVFEAAKPE